ncbi:MAG TPA: hypothetical protein VN649_15640 [Ramlibacter sp.]|nr:hypothetical protein [Ramlibacter sp.]
MRSVIAIVLCILAASAAAQCPSQAQVAQAARPSPELIKTAAAATHTEQALAAEDGLPAAGDTASATAPKSDGKGSHRAGPAMLLAAVALMSGIALRRFLTRTK